MPKPSAAQRQSAEEQTEHAKGGLVMETGPERDSLRQMIESQGRQISVLTSMMEEETKTRTRQSDELIASMQNLNDKVDRETTNMADRITGVIHRMDRLEEDARKNDKPLVGEVEDDNKTKDRVKEAQGRLRRAWHTVRPEKFTRDDVKPVVYTNLAEYLALVSCAHLWPVGTMSVISRALFI